MTPLDRFLNQFPILKDLIFWLEDNLVIIVVVPFFLFLVFIFYWIFVLAPRRAEKAMKSLMRDGYSQIQPDDSQLAKVVEQLTPIIYHSYELCTVTKTTPWSVDLAYGKSAGQAPKFFAHIKRSVTRNPPGGGYVVKSEFTAAFFESRALPFTQDVHIAGDHYPLDADHGLQRVSDEDLESLGSLGSLSSLYVFYTSTGKLNPLPPQLVEGLLESGPLLSISSEAGHKNDPFLFNARVRFTPEGWGLISNELVYSKEKMDALLTVVNRISESLPR